MKKRFLSMLLVTVLAVSLIAGFALSASATPASYPFQSTVPITGHGWTGWQNVLNSIPSTSDYDSMRADGTPYAVLKATLDSAKSTYGEIADGASPNYDSVTTSTGQTLTAYADSVFGRAFYMFDGGKQLAYELWNSTVDSSVKLIRKLLYVCHRRFADDISFRSVSGGNQRARRLHKKLSLRQSVRKC